MRDALSFASLTSWSPVLKVSTSKLALQFCRPRILTRPSSTSRRSMCVAVERAPTGVARAADLTKWVVCAAVGITMLIRRDHIIILYVCGALINSASGKLLKRVINQARPEGTRMSDPGMPSSHATSLSFLSLSLAAAVLAAPAWGALGAALVVTAAVIATSWRVSAGYHTLAQVCAGWMLGSFNAALYRFGVVLRIGPLAETLMATLGRTNTTVAVLVLVRALSLDPFASSSLEDFRP